MKRHLPTLTLVLALLLPAALPAALNTVAGLYEAGEYDEARRALEAGGEGARPAEEAMWRSRLSTDPDEALSLLRAALADRSLARDLRLRLALEAADIEFGRAGYAALLRDLSQFLAEDPGLLPGAVHLRAGLALKALGNWQQAREMLASVRPDDPSFGLARVALGDIGLEQNDPDLAARYYDSAVSADPRAERSAAAGRWRILRLEGRDEAAAALVADLRRDAPGSLALLDIQRRHWAEQEEQAARLADAPVDTVATRAEAPAGRYALQLGAFSDRGLALEFHRRLQSQVPDLRIDEVRDDRGQYLYKVRSGAFNNPALARTAASDLADRLDLEVIVADSATDGAGRD